MTYSSNFSQIYDSLIEGYETIIHPTQKLIYEFTQKKQKIDLLELGCGTGTVLQSFPHSFTLSGLDISPGMLEIARKKVKRATFIEGDMSNFYIAKKFDVIICVFDSINHLTTFTKWQNTFLCVNKHLKKNGLFVFDMNTQKRHASLIKLPPYIKRTNNNLTCFTVLPGRKNIYLARIQVFKDILSKNISLVEETIPEASFSNKKVIRALQKHFTIEKMLDAYREKVTKETGRVFFACRKK